MKLVNFPASTFLFPFEHLPNFITHNNICISYFYDTYDRGTLVLSRACTADRLRSAPNTLVVGQGGNDVYPPLTTSPSTLVRGCL